MKGKNVAVFALGAATGFAGCGIWAIRKVIKSERIKKAIVKVGMEAAIDWVYGDDARYKTTRVSYRTMHGEKGDKQ